MRRLLLAFLLAATPCVAVAADSGLGQIALGTGDVLRGDFTEERHLQGFKGPMTSEGHFVVAPSRGLIWKIEKPFPTTTVITPAGLIQTVAGVKVMQLPAQKIPFLLHLYDMLGGALAGNWKPLEAEFIVTRSDDLENWQVTLSPRKADNPGMPFSLITVNGHRFVENVILLKPDGDSDTLAFRNEAISRSPPTMTESAALDSVRP
jgi:hypothetical protein